MKSLIHAVSDATIGEKLDKDRFRRDLGNIEEAYKEMLFVLLANAPKGAINELRSCF